MTWDFCTDPGLQADLDWTDEFVRSEIESLDVLLGSPFDRDDTATMAVIRRLQQRVKDRGLWSCHLGSELGGSGYGQIQLALLNEILGRSRWAPSIFGCQAPDSGNAEILARFGTEQQRKDFLDPLLEGRICSCYAMTEPGGGADPTLFTTAARRDGDDWVLNGEKWFASNARWAGFFITMAVTDPSAPPHNRTSMFIIPAATPGLRIVRNLGLGTDQPGEGSHAYLRFEDLRVPADALLGEPGHAFVVAQARLAGGRIHHAMRTIGKVRRAFDAMCERAVSRDARSGSLGGLQLVQEQIAESWLQIEQFRLLVLRTAWKMDHADEREVRGDIAAVKVAMPKVFRDVVQRTMHLHGALGVSDEMPFAAWLLEAESMGIADGPTEVHLVTLAKQLLRGRAPADGLWPTEHLPSRRATAVEQYGPDLAHLDLEHLAGGR